MDDAVLKRLQKLGGEQLVEQMIDLFLENAPRRIEAAREAVGEEDRKAVARATHSLKTTAGNLGATQLQRLAADIEKSADGGALAEVSAMLEELERAYAPVKARLEKERRSLTK